MELGGGVRRGMMTMMLSMILMIIMINNHNAHLFEEIDTNSSSDSPVKKS